MNEYEEGKVALAVAFLMQRRKLTIDPVTKQNYWWIIEILRGTKQ